MRFLPAALALSQEPGIPIGDGCAFPLNYDVLPTTSIFYPQPIGLNKSIGYLNAQGNTAATWKIPSALKNTAVWLAFVTADPTVAFPKGVVSISKAVPTAITTGSI